ncbi:putative major vault protein [Trypanosoma vivax]|nr:putative major vault protein [Trypanosoma vivax]
MSADSSAIRVNQHHYVHVLDNTTNVARCIIGPVVYTLKEHECCLFDPRSCIVVPPSCYCVVRNPFVRDEAGSPVLDERAVVELRVGEEEIRLEQQPFPLFPGEELKVVDGEWLFQLQVIGADRGYHVRCVSGFVDEERGAVLPGKEWIVPGPKTYIPRVEVEVLREIEAYIIRPNMALKLRALADFTDSNGMTRRAGEEWLIRDTCAYLPQIEEKVMGTVEGVVLTETEGIHLQAQNTFVDVQGKKRVAGEQWLVTNKECQTYIPDVHEKIISTAKVVVLDAQQFCVVADPVDDNRVNQFGKKEMRKGKLSFFLHPGERLVGGVQPVITVGKDEALLLQAVGSFTEESSARLRTPGETWMLHGPVEYTPNVDVVVLEHRGVIALDKNEGIYVMNTKSGQVKAVIGEPYMLKEFEVLWDKELPRDVEELLQCGTGCCKNSERDPNFKSSRLKHHIVRFNVQHNAAVRIYDYKQKKPRVVLGPNLVMLSPDEEFTVLSLSGGKPKVPNSLHTLQLFLGPRFSSDAVVVETCDHARLQLSLSYNWYFDLDRKRPDAKIFSVPDFVGDCCKTIASRVRGAVAAVDFDSFHRNSARIIREAVFGCGEDGQVRNCLRFSANNLIVTNIDIQSVEPTDAKTRESLQKSVQLAIEITAKSQEAAARHDKERKDQEARGQLERQKLLDKIEVERTKTEWLKLQAESEAVQACGQSVAEAQAKAESLLIEVEAELKQAKVRAMILRMTAESDLKRQKQRQELELEYTKSQNLLEIARASEIAEAEIEKVRRTVEAIGRETLITIARSGPEMQAKLLEGLGLHGYLTTDGKTPVNVLGAVQSLLGGVSHKSQP